VQTYRATREIIILVGLDGSADIDGFMACKPVPGGSEDAGLQQTATPGAARLGRGRLPGADEPRPPLGARQEAEGRSRRDRLAWSRGTPA
jgi:hypothetical protein